MKHVLTEQFNLRLSPDVAASIDAAAARECLTPSAFVRRIVMRELRLSMKPRRPDTQNAA
ncbi:uncharacterized protein (DUF1778 family) [Ancylobacter sp. 3268]|uniref:hypothetical protein n=1 Tax=Ancylobacter sp. 3268 TaxID=2817752 RepID=UPI00285AC9F3|nr:hypothetical protein [Ancylobacter sp. 3268]MDR6955982.1 uncharacterized protein (DUF1778 family) [Ancylobacter sp. 3268]